MKRIEAIIREEKVHDVREALEDAGVVGMTVLPARGRGAQQGIALEWRVGGRGHRVHFLPKACIIVVVRDEDADRILDAIMSAAYTGRNGDGKVFVSAVEQVYRVRTRESGEAVI